MVIAVWWINSANGGGFGGVALSGEYGQNFRIIIPFAPNASLLRYIFWLRSRVMLTSLFTSLCMLSVFWRPSTKLTFTSFLSHFQQHGQRIQNHVEQLVRSGDVDGLCVAIDRYVHDKSERLPIPEGMWHFSLSTHPTDLIPFLLFVTFLIHLLSLSKAITNDLFQMSRSDA